MRLIKKPFITALFTVLCMAIMVMPAFAGGEWHASLVSGMQPVPYSSDGILYVIKGMKFDAGAGAKTSDPKILKTTRKGRAKVVGTGDALIVSPIYGLANIQGIAPRLSATRLSMVVGGKETLSLNGLPDGMPVAWVSSDRSIVQVSEGQCYAVGVGKSKISAYVCGVPFTANVTVKDSPDTTLVIDAPAGSNKKLKLKGAEKPAGAWTDGNIAIKGSRLTAKSASEVPISANTASRQLLIYANSTKQSSQNITMQVGQGVFAFSGPTHEIPVWKSSDPDVALVTEYGLIIAQSAGKAKLSTKAGGKTVKIKVTVTDEPYPGGRNDTRVIRIVDNVNNHQAVDYAVTDRCEVFEGATVPPEEEDALNPSKNQEIKYTVEHWQMGFDEKDYSCFEKEVLTCDPGATVTPEVKQYEGFTPPKEESATIIKNGQTIIYKYKRNKYSVSTICDQTIAYITGGGTYYYGEQVNLTAVMKSYSSDEYYAYTEQDGYRYRQAQAYIFKQWSDGKTTINNTFPMPACDLELTGQGSKATVLDEQYRLKTSIADGIKSVTSGGWYQKGAKVELSAIPMDTYSDTEITYNTNNTSRYKGTHSFGEPEWSNGVKGRTTTITMNAPTNISVSAKETIDGLVEHKVELVSGDGIYNVAINNRDATEKWVLEGSEVSVLCNIMPETEDIEYTEDTEKYFNLKTSANAEIHVPWERYKKVSQWAFQGWTDQQGKTVSDKRLYSFEVTAPVKLTPKTKETTEKTDIQDMLYLVKGPYIKEYRHSGTLLQEGGNWFPQGQDVAVTAVAKDDCSFRYWDDWEEENPRTFTLDEGVYAYAYGMPEYFTLTWDEPLSTEGEYLGNNPEIITSPTNAGWKRIVYTDTDGNTAYANPYEPGSIQIMPDQAVGLQMVAGDYVSSRVRNTVEWYVYYRQSNSCKLVVEAPATSTRELITSWVFMTEDTIFSNTVPAGTTGITKHPSAPTGKTVFHWQLKCEMPRNDTD